MMKRYLTLIAAPLFALAGQQATAGSIICGTYIIQDDQINAQTRSEVEEKCGTPVDTSGDDLFYKQDNAMYRLHFNDADELESITEQVD